MNDEPTDDRPTGDDLNQQLKSLLGAASDVGPRTVADVDRRLRATSTSSLCLELLGVGWWSLATVLGDAAPGLDPGTNLSGPPPGADEEGRGAGHG